MPSPSHRPSSASILLTSVNPDLRSFSMTCWIGIQSSPGRSAYAKLTEPADRTTAKTKGAILFMRTSWRLRNNYFRIIVESGHSQIQLRTLRGKYRQYPAAHGTDWQLHNVS